MHFVLLSLIRKDESLAFLPPSAEKKIDTNRFYKGSQGTASVEKTVSINIWCPELQEQAPFVVEYFCRYPTPFGWSWMAIGWRVILSSWEIPRAEGYNYRWPPNTNHPHHQFLKIRLLPQIHKAMTRKNSWSDKLCFLTAPPPQKKKGDPFIHAGPYFPGVLFTANESCWRIDKWQAGRRTAA